MFLGLYNTVDDISKRATIAQGRDISSHLKHFVKEKSSYIANHHFKHSSFSDIPTKYFYVHGACDVTVGEVDNIIIG